MGSPVGRIEPDPDAEPTEDAAPETIRRKNKRRRRAEDFHDASPKMMNQLTQALTREEKENEKLRRKLREERDLGHVTHQLDASLVREGRLGRRR